MHKKLTSLITLTLCLLVGCTSKDNTAYLDNSKIENNKLEVTFNASIINEGLNIKLTLLNKEDNEKEIKFSKYLLTNEVSKETYNVSNVKRLNENNAITLNNTYEYVEFRFNEKLNYYNDEYYFSFKMNNTSYRFNIYEQDKENNEFYFVTYKIDDKEVCKEKRMKDSDVNYEWFSNDYVSYASKWYLDEALENEVSATYKLTNDVTLYGKKANTLKYTHLFDDTYRVESANYISNNKEVVIPRVYKNHAVAKFLKETFNNPENKDTIERLYIGKNIIQIPNVNKMVEVKEIHYEGTEEEWNNVYQGDFEGNIVYNSYVD